MGGSVLEKGDARGVLPRFCESVFDAISIADEYLQFTMKVSMVEIYQEQVR